MANAAKTDPDRLAHLAALIGALIGCGLLAYGVTSGSLAHSIGWHLLEARDVFITLALPTVALGVAAFTRRWILVVFAVTTAAAIVTFGLPPSFVFVVGALGAFAVGRIVMPRDAKRPIESALLATVLGLGALATLISWTARAPVHYDFVYAIVAIIAIVWRRRDVMELARDVLAQIAESQARPRSLDAIVNRIAISIAVLTAILLSLYATMPEMGYDPLYMHFTIIDSLRSNGHWDYDYGLLKFTLTPKLAIWTIGFFHVLGGEMASRAFNLVAVCAVCGLIAGRLRPLLPSGLIGVLAATLLSTPMTHWITSWMFEEAPTTLYLFSAAIFFFRTVNEARPGREGVLGLASLGFAVASKVTALFAGFLGVFFVIALVRRLGLARGMAASAFGAAVFAVAALFPYLQAYLLTGNPFYPFHPATTLDARWEHKLTPDIWFRFVFNTDNYAETMNGSFGLQNLPALLAAGLFSLFTRDWKIRALFVAFAIMGGALLMQTQYARYYYYLYPELLLFAGIAFAQAPRIVHALAGGALLAMTLGNLALLRTIYVPPYSLGVLTDPFTNTPLPPERRIYAALNALQGSSPHVFVAGTEPYSGGLAGRAEAVSPLVDFVNAASNPADVVTALQRAGITHITAVNGFRSPLMERLCLRVCREIDTGLGPNGRLFVFDPSDFDPAAPGFTITRFAAGQPGTAWLGEGWSTPEQFGVWSLGRSAHLHIPAMLNDAPVRTLKFDLLVAARPGQMQVITFLVNGLPVRASGFPASADFVTPGTATITLAPPIDLHQAPQQLDLELQVANPISPQQAGVNADERVLGVGLAQVILDTK